MTTLTSIRKALQEGSAANLLTYGPWEAAFYPRDHRDYPDHRLINRAIGQIQWPMTFEVSNPNSDEILTVVTNCTHLEDWLRQDTSGVLDGLGLIQDDIVKFASFEELAEMAIDAFETWGD